LCEDALVDAHVIADKVSIRIKPVSYTGQTDVSAGSQDGQIGCENQSDWYCVASCPLFILLCVISCHMHHVYLYDTFTLVSTPQIERYKGSSMILIEYVQMACLGHFLDFSGNARFQGELLIYL
jgi:hypothetical protein